MVFMAFLMLLTMSISPVLTPVKRIAIQAETLQAVTGFIPLQDRGAFVTDMMTQKVFYLNEDYSAVRIEAGVWGKGPASSVA